MKKVLDKGFVRLVDKMGDDSSPVQAARISYGRGVKTPQEDKNLINYLMRNYHETPFEMVQLKFHIKAPIFVARQWFRHRSSSFNEISARYTEVKDEFYVPELDQVKPQSNSNHQGRSEESFSNDLERDIRAAIGNSETMSYNTYKKFISLGVAKELARSVLPVAQYTEFYWSINLRNLFNFLKLRLDSHAQYEIRVYAEELARIVEHNFPNCYQAFKKFRLNSKSFSQEALKLIKDLAENKEISIDNYDMSKREYNEIMYFFDKNN